MSTEVKRRRGNTSEHSSFVGAVAEITVDTDKDTAVCHDGSTAGGFPLLREDFNNAVWTTPDARYLLESNNLSDLDSASTGRVNLGLTDASADLDLNSISVNGTNLFPDNDPQDLGIGDSPTFAGGTISLGNALVFQRSDGGGTGSILNSDGLTIRNLSASDSGIHFLTGTSSYVERMRVHSTGGISVGGSSLTSGSTFTVNGDADITGNLDVSGNVEVQENLFVEGGLFAKEFTVDTTRVFLSSRFGSGGVVGEIVDATVGSEQIKFVDQDGNAIVPFADNDLLLIQQRTGVNSGTIVKKIKRKVVADGQPSNVVSLTTTGVTTGTDIGTIAVGDQAVLDGNTTDTDRDSFIAVDVLDRDIAAFGFIDNQTDFGNGTEVMRVGGMEPGGANEYDSSLTGDIGIAGKIGGNLAFALTEDEGLVGGANFDSEAMWSVNNSKTFQGTGLYINWQDEDFSLGSEFYYDSSLTKLFLDGTFEVSSSGEITNSGSDYAINADGMKISQQTTDYDPLNSLNFVDTIANDSLQGRVTVDSSGNFEVRAVVDELYLYANDRIRMIANKLRLPDPVSVGTLEAGDIYYDSANGDIIFYDGTNSYFLNKTQI